MQVSSSEEATNGPSVDTVVRKCTGYCFCVQAGVIHQLLLLTTLLLSSVAPQLCVWLLLRKCPLTKAELVRVKLRNGKQHLVRIKLLHPARLPKRQQWINQQSAKGPRVPHRVFCVSARLYLFNSDLSAFLPLDDMPSNMPQQIWSAVQDLAEIDAGADWTRFNLPTKWPRRDRCLLYGNNDLQLAKPYFFPILLQTLSFVLFIVQYGELVFACWYGRQTFTAILVAITVLACLRTTIRTYGKRKMLIRVLDQQCVVPFVWVGRIIAMSSRQLVPGDVVVVQRGKVTCDMVLLRGASLVEESMMSGEAAQVRKHSYKADNSMAAAKYHPDSHQTCTIFAGTVVHQMWNDEDQADEVLAMVVRTGCNSTIGNMLRHALRPSNFLSATDSLVRDIFGIYLFSFIIHFLLYIPTVKSKSKMDTLKAEAFFRFLNTIIMAMPVGVPAVMIFAVVVAIQRLQWRRIAVLYPGQLKLAANVDIACFDKTGTLTGSEEGFFGMLPIRRAKFEGELQKYGMGWSKSLKIAGAVCNGLVMKGKTSVIGDALEKQLFKAVEAQYVEHNTVVLPHRASRKQDVSCLVKLHIIKRFEFTSHTMKSGAVVVPEDAPPDTALLLVKGAPSVIKHMSRPGSIPENFDRVVDDWTSRSFRLLALAAGTIKSFSSFNPHTLTLPQAEAAVTHMSLVGVIVVTNQLRPDSKDTISELQDDGGIRTMMITGDYHQTAVAVAWGVGMVPAGGIVHVIDKAPTTATVSPPSSPVHIASARSLFTRDLSDLVGSDSNLTRRPSPAWSKLRPSLSGPVELDPVEVTRDALLAAPLRQNKGSQAPSQLPQPVPSEQRQARTKSALKITSSLDSSTTSPAGLEPQGSEHFHLQCDGLRFFLGHGDVRQDAEALRALTNIAEGQAQCAVTGAAFEHLLQQEDLSVLEAVLQNAVVFARMRPDQKAQVLSLLGSAGLHQNFHGRHRHIPGQQQTVLFCGDGLNDLAALGTAEVGMAIGPIDAMAAAPVSTKRSSIAGSATLIKEARASHVKLLGLIKYMIVYQLVQSLAVNVVFLVDGIFLSELQLAMIDIQAMVWSLIAAITPPNPRLTPTKPTMKLCSKRILLPVVEVIVLAGVTQMACFLLMEAQSRYHGGNSSNQNNPVVTVAWSVANYCLQGQIMGWKVDTWPHSQGPGSNKPLIIVSLLIAIFAHVFVAAGFLFTKQPLSLYHFPQRFRFEFYGILLTSAFIFVVQRAVRQFMRRAQQQKYQALLRESGGSRQLSSSRNSMGSAEKLLPNAYSLGMQELITKLRWLTFRAPKIVPITSEMSVVAATRSSTRSHTAKVHPLAESKAISAQKSVHDKV